MPLQGKTEWMGNWEISYILRITQPPFLCQESVLWHFSAIEMELVEALIGGVPMPVENLSLDKNSWLPFKALAKAEVFKLMQVDNEIFYI